MREIKFRAWHETKQKEMLESKKRYVIPFIRHSGKKRYYEMLKKIRMI